MRSLTIISHTDHYINSEGVVLGFGPTVTEINNLLEIFDEIFHVAMLHKKGSVPASAMPYVKNKVKFIPIQQVGGKQIKDKLKIIWQAPSILNRIKKTIKQTDYFQFRAPTGIGVFVIPYLVLFNSKKGWFKYAGNWNQRNAPLAYSFQRYILKKQKRIVTINGRWQNQPKQCLTFENPCLTNKEVEEGQSIISKKTIEKGLINLCFVGRLEKEKGIDILIKTLINFPENEKAKINKIHIVGSGVSLDLYKEKGNNSDLNFCFHGFLSRNEVQTIYKESHAIILPSASEGFPKVIAEAMNFGCLPIVSNVSSISHYIKDGENGFLLNSISVEGLEQKLLELLSLTEVEYRGMINVQKNEMYKFTYSNYNKRILKILNHLA